MPRIARVKAENAIYHVIVRSISEVDLFRENEDKEKYMSIIKICKNIFLFKIYAYCLMDNHAHFMIWSNGADISKIMQSLNLRYVLYYNRKYGRHGHLFQDRFKSKIITDEKYLLTLSAYIHNNPTDIEKYKDCPEKYSYSSLGIYLGMKKDPYEVLDEDFVMQLFGEDIEKARKNYFSFVFRCDNEEFKDQVEFLNEKTEYRSERKLLVRNFTKENIIDFVCEKMHINKINLYVKNCKKITEAKALIVLLMRGLCNFKCSDICKALGNITEANVSRLCNKAVEFISKNENYRNIVKEFLEEYAV